MTTTTPPTRRAPRPAAPACSSSSIDFHSEKTGTQRRARTICHGCPLIVECLQRTLAQEGSSGYKWGVFGGLTADQRRALYCERLLGNVPDLEAAWQLTSGRWRQVLYPMRYKGFTPAQMALVLARTYGLAVTPVTVRVAVWWQGGKGPVGPRRRDGDGRLDWQLVRDESRSLVQRLRDAGASKRDVAAYLDVTPYTVEAAVRAWSEETMVQDLGVAA